MKVAIFGKNFNDSFDKVIQHLLDSLASKGVLLFIHVDFLAYLVDKKGIVFHYTGVYRNKEDLPKDLSFLLSVGGDGTFLKSK